MRTLTLALLFFSLSTLATAASREKVEQNLNAAFENSRIDKREWLALTWSLLATAADIYTSERGHRRGCVENGAIYSEGPSRTELLIPAAVMTAAQIYVYKRDDFPTAHWFGWVYGGFRMAGAVHNTQLSCYRSQ
jgi:hypothetical protein